MTATVYLDQNHLSMVSSVSGAVTADTRAHLDRLIGCGRVQLVVSMAHVIESAQWSDAIARDQVIRWVDARPLLWVPMDAVAKQWEAVRFLRKMLDLPDEAIPSDALHGVYPLMSPDQLADMGTRLPIVQESRFGPLVAEMAGSEALKAILHGFQQMLVAQNTSLLAGASGSQLTAQQTRVLSSTIDAVMAVAVLPKRLDGGRALDEETLRRFVDAYARADARFRRFSEQLDSALKSVRRNQLPKRPLDGVHMDDYVRTAAAVGRIKVNDLLDKQHATAALYVDAYVCDHEFAEIVGQAVRDVPRAARVFGDLADAVEWLRELPAPEA